MKGDDDDDDGEGGWSDDDFSDGGMPEDDDDTSWKVRRAAVAIIDAIVKTRQDKVKEIISRYADTLIDRVKERIDDVKVDILYTLQGIIKASMEVKENNIDMDLKAQTSVARQLSIGEDLKVKQAAIIKMLSKPMKSKNMKVKVAAIETISTYTLLVQFKLD